jgi:hypothetical protein
MVQVGDERRCTYRVQTSVARPGRPRWTISVIRKI